jgi:hypothetical protein
MNDSEIAYRLNVDNAACIADKITDVVINHLRRQPEFAGASRVDLEIKFGDLHGEITSIVKREIDGRPWVQE